LAVTNSRGAPGNAALVVLGCALSVIVAGLFLPSGDRFHTIFVAATAQGLLLVSVYTGIAVGAVRLMVVSKTRQPWWRWIVFPLATVVPVLALYGSFVPFPAYPERIGLYTAIVAVAVIFGWLWAYRRRAEDLSGRTSGRV
jgi:amino acid transporter